MFPWAAPKLLPLEIFKNIFFISFFAYFLCHVLWDRLCLICQKNEMQRKPARNLSASWCHFVFKCISIRWTKKQKHWQQISRFISEVLGPCSLFVNVYPQTQNCLCSHSGWCTCSCTYFCLMFMLKLWASGCDTSIMWSSNIENINLLIIRHSPTLYQFKLNLNSNVLLHCWTISERNTGLFPPLQSLDSYS